MPVLNDWNSVQEVIARGVYDDISGGGLYQTLKEADEAEKALMVAFGPWLGKNVPVKGKQINELLSEKPKSVTERKPKSYYKRLKRKKWPTQETLSPGPQYYKDELIKVRKACHRAYQISLKERYKLLLKTYGYKLECWLNLLKEAKREISLRLAFPYDYDYYSSCRWKVLSLRHTSFISEIKRDAAKALRVLVRSNGIPGEVLDFSGINEVVSI